MVCRLDYATIQQYLGNPTATPSFLNTEWVEPVLGDVLYTPSEWSIEIFYGLVPYQFGYYYNSDTGRMKVSESFGSSTIYSFAISDYLDDPITGNQNVSILPFVPVNEQRCLIRNWNQGDPVGRYTYVDGSIKNPQKKPLGQRSDLSLKNDYIITCVGLYHELERRTIREVYTFAKVGFMVKDAITRYSTLDASAIDATLGITITRKSWKNQTPAQVLEWACDLMGWTFWIDDSTRKIYVGPKESVLNQISTLVFTDSGPNNVYNYFFFDGFDIHTDSSLIKNDGILEYKQIYDAGTVNFSFGSPIVVAYTGSPDGTLPPLTFWDNLPPGIMLRNVSGLSGVDGAYSVAKNQSNGPTQTLILSSGYQDAGPYTNQPYQLTGIPATAFSSDYTSQTTLSSIKGDDGVFSFVMTEDSNDFTAEEAQQYLDAVVTAMSQPLPSGGGESYNDVLNFLPLHVGMMFSFNLTITQKFQGRLALMSLEIEDLDGCVFPDESGDGKTHPHVKLKLGFDAKLSDPVAQQKAILQQKGRRTVSLSDNDQFNFYQKIPEIRASYDCQEIREDVLEVTMYIDMMNFWDDYWYGFIT